MYLKLLSRIQRWFCHTHHIESQVERKHFIDLVCQVEGSEQWGKLYLLRSPHHLLQSLLQDGGVSSSASREPSVGRGDWLCSKSLRSTLSSTFCLPCFSTELLNFILRIPRSNRPRLGCRCRIKEAQIVSYPVLSILSHSDHQLGKTNSPELLG